MQLSSRIRQFYPEHYLPYNRKIIQWWYVSIERIVVIHTARNIACREEHLRWFNISDSCCVLFLMVCCIPLAVLKLCFVLGSPSLPSPSLHPWDSVWPRLLAAAECIFGRLCGLLVWFWVAALRCVKNGVGWRLGTQLQHGATLAGWGMFT